MNGLYGTSLTGLSGASTALEVTAENIANVNTGGFAEMEPIMAALPNTMAVGPEQFTGTTSAARSVGMGVAPSTTMRSIAQAPLRQTGRPFDLAVAGSAFMTLRRSDGTLVYTRQAALDIKADGTLMTGGGLSLSPAIRVPATALHPQIDAQGRVTAERADGRPLLLGRVALVTFAAPENLAEQGAGLYVPTAGSGTPTIARTGLVPGGSQVLSGYQLGSTVDLATQFSNMLDEQRTYEINAKALQTIDSLVNTAVSLSQHN